MPEVSSEGESRREPRLLVVGCGGPLASDDNVGLEIVHRLQSGGGCGCEFLEVKGGGLDLLYSFDKAEIMLFVDAVQSGAAPGTVHLLPLSSGEIATRAVGRVSSHGWGLTETLRLAGSLGMRVPRMMLLGLELGSVTPGLTRTPAVEAALEAIVACFSELQGALRNSESPLWAVHHRYAFLTEGFTKVNGS